MRALALFCSLSLEGEDPLFPDSRKDPLPFHSPLPSPCYSRGPVPSVPNSNDPFPFFPRFGLADPPSHSDSRQHPWLSPFLVVPSTALRSRFFPFPALLTSLSPPSPEASVFHSLHPVSGLRTQTTPPFPFVWLNHVCLFFHACCWTLSLGSSLSRFLSLE